VALGRYPYTSHFGRLTARDIAIVDESLARVNGLELKDKAFDAISDGQRQRIMLARAICQRPEIIVLDEPTSFLDVRYKIELLEILKRMSKENGITIVMSLHEIDLAQKISDVVVCVKGEKIAKFGPPEEIFTENVINELYGISPGAYNLSFGSVELGKPVGAAKTFVLAGGGRGIPFYRGLQRGNIPFYTGILFDNDIDFQVARALAAEVFTEQAFCGVSDETYQRAARALSACERVIDAGTEIRDHNRANGELRDLAKRLNIPIGSRLEVLI
jgi:iron complex transport system ATP-binding protein